MCQKNLPFCLMILKVSINLKNMENLNKVLAQCLKFWATHEWQKRSPHSLSQWVQINETSVLKHMYFCFLTFCLQHSQDLNLILYVQKVLCCWQYLMCKHSTGGTQCNFTSCRFTEVNLTNLSVLTHVSFIHRHAGHAVPIHTVLWQMAPMYIIHVACSA